MYQTNLYELEAIIALGMRVSSKKGTQFRIWSRKILKEYMKRCPVCGQTFDPEDLDQTFHHGPDSHEPLGACGS